MTSTGQDPILASWKISDVLRRDPRLLEVLVPLSPAFARLRNPLLRRVQARLVTVAQAAAIAGLEPATLVRQLNVAAGITPPEPDRAPTEVIPSIAPPDWVGTAPVARELDARPILARGEEPFRAIMGAARSVPVGSVLRLHAGFEPVPLHDALGKVGFGHWGVEVGSGHWQVDFCRLHAAGGQTGTDTPAALDWDGPVLAEVTIDVSELVPPEPMVKILQALEDLPAGAQLLVHHVRRPVHLYDRLDELGYPHRTRDIAAGQVELRIRKPSAPGGPA